MAKKEILERNKIQKQFWAVGCLFLQSGMHEVNYFYNIDKFLLHVHCTVILI